VSQSSLLARLQPGRPLFWVLFLVVLVPDWFSKRWAETALLPRHVPHEVIGEYLRFTLSYNQGAAFGMHVGESSRWFFAVLAVAIIALMLWATRDLTRESTPAALGLPLVLGGAVGNLLDRLRDAAAVVDFIDVGVGTTRFWTFNIADSGITVGAICLVLAMWVGERPAAASASSEQSTA
jgi:signal peptidase II